MKKIFSALMVAGTLLLAPLGSAQAASVSTDTWYEFRFEGPGSALSAGVNVTPLINPTAVLAPEVPWEFSVATNALLFVTDAFNSGDQFELFDFGASLGLTSIPTRGVSCGSDLTCALTNVSFSSGSFLLAPGNHSITGIAILSPFNTGAGAFRINGVPLPATVPLVLVGLAGLGMVTRRRKQLAA